MIFEDPTRRRWRRAILAGAVVGILSAFLMTCVAMGSFRSPRLNGVAPASAGRMAPSGELIPTEEPSNVSAVGGQRRTVSPLLTRQWITSAFVVQDDPRSVADLEARREKIDVVFPDWYSFKESSGRLVRKVNPRLAGIFASGGAAVMPRLSNTDETGAWQGDAATEMLKDWDARPRLIASLVASLEQDHAAGVNIDIEGLEPGDRENLLDWLHDLAKALHGKNLLLSVDVPLNDEAFDYEAIGSIADVVVVMAYDEHFPSGASGPIAGKGWFDDGIDDMVRRIPPSKLLVALGGYGYDWNLARKKDAEALGFDEAMAVAARRGADIRADASSLNSTFRYREENGDLHEVWFLDAVSAWNQTLEARRLGVRGISVWRMGLEEPILWEFLGAPDSFDPQRLSAVGQLNDVELSGAGELLNVGRIPEEGKRAISLDDRVVESAVYRSLPGSYSATRFGHDPGRRVALTFDDGPDPVWTPQVLQVLRKYGVPATFFVVGDQSEHFPQLVRQEYREGHLVGNHTFTHPHFEAISDARQRMELNLTQRTIESITGHSTILFRSPYDVDSAPANPSVLRGLANVSRLGYVVACADVDSEDYARPGADRIVANVVTRLGQTGSNVVIMHDSGGERSQTVEALDRLIPLLKRQGYEFVGLDRLMGVPRDAVMAPVRPGERAIAESGGLLIWMRTRGWQILQLLFLGATAIAIVRILFVGWFALRLRCHLPAAATPFLPPVAVVVPAFNEARVIRRTIETLLAGDYPHIRVLVIDDGSTDETPRIVADMAGHDSRITLLSRPNGGKHAALNLGFREATEEIVVTVDADTVVLPHTISRLVEPFADPAVDAVCGNVQVGNVKNLLTAFQDVEYVTSQNYDRRAFDSLNCISVVPGATGAWRRSTVLRVGGYSADTLTEDADLTLSVLAAGGRIVYAPEARSVTEAPETARPLFKQRFRWSFGTFQCLWKHRKELGRGTHGRIALPNLLVFQFLFPLLSPVGDAVFIWSLLRGEFGAVAAGYVTFVLLDLVASLVAFRLDRRPLSRLGVVVLQRLYYRQFMYAVTFKAALAALRGGRHGWNKLDRKATALGVACSGQLPELLAESAEL